MKIISYDCPHCGAALKVNSGSTTEYCEHCGSYFRIDDEVQHIQYDNMEEAGYQFERGRQKAIRESHSSFASLDFHDTCQKKYTALKEVQDLKEYVDKRSL